MAAAPDPRRLAPIPPARSTYDATQRAGERQSQDAGGNYAQPTYTITKTDETGSIHTVTIDSKTGIAFDDKITGHVAAPPRSVVPYGTGASGPSWYEKQQVTLDQRRLADQEAQQKAAEKLTESNAVEDFNKSYRDFQAKSFYGSQYGPTYFSPMGSAFPQRAPESALLKQAFANSGTPDPWLTPGNVPAGYTGTTYSNAQHPGATSYGAPSVQTIPQDNSGLINAIDSHPGANEYALSIPGVKEAAQSIMANGATAPTNNGGQ